MLGQPLYTNIVFILNGAVFLFAAADALVRTARFRWGSAPEPQTLSYDFLELILFAFTATAAFVFRLVYMPIDPGGIFFQSMVVLGGLGFAVVTRLTYFYRYAFRAAALPALFFALYGGVYFNVNAAYAVALLIAAVLFVVFSLAAKKILWAVLAAVFSVFWFMVAESSLVHTHFVFYTKTLDARDIKQIDFKPFKDETGTLQPVSVTSRDHIQKIAGAMAFTSPYISERHEVIRKPYYLVKITRTDGKAAAFWLGRGNRVYPPTAWVEYAGTTMSRGVYQNGKLYDTILDLKLPLWQNIKQKPEHPGDKEGLLVVGIFLHLILLLTTIGMATEYRKKNRGKNHKQKSKQKSKSKPK